MAHGSVLAYSVALASTDGGRLAEASRRTRISEWLVASVAPLFMLCDSAITSPSSTTSEAKGWRPASRERCALAMTRRR